MVESRGAVFFVDPVRAKLLIEPSPAVAAAAQRLGFHQRISGIIDIAELAKAPRESFDVGLPVAVPAALPELPREIGSQLRPARRVPADIAQRELFELLRA